MSISLQPSQASRYCKHSYFPMQGLCRNKRGLLKSALFAILLHTKISIPANSPGFPGVSKFFMKSPGLLGRAPNLQGNTYGGLFELCLLILVISRWLFAVSPPPPPHPSTEALNVGLMTRFCWDRGTKRTDF